MSAPVLLPADANGAGDYSPVPAPISVQASGVSVPVANVPVSAGGATAVWEINTATPMSLAISDSLNFAVFLSYPGNAAAQTGTVTLFLAPLSGAGPSVVPRFSSTLNQTAVATVPATVPPADVIPNLTISSPATMGAQVTGTIALKNQGTGPTVTPAGLRVMFYSGTMPLGYPFDCGVSGGLPAGATTTACNWSLTAPPAAGNYSVVAEAVYFDAESDKLNNTVKVPFNVEACRWSLARNILVVPASGGPAEIPLQTQSGCPGPPVQSSSASWVSAVALNGAAVRFQLYPNFRTIPIRQPSVVGRRSRCGRRAPHAPTAFSCIAVSAFRGGMKSIQVETQEGVRGRRCFRQTGYRERHRHPTPFRWDRDELTSPLPGTSKRSA